MKKFLNSTLFKLLLPVVFYFIGIAFIERKNIEPLKHLGYAEQEEYSYVDRDGEEHEGETLIKIEGLGKILTYQDLYFASIPIFVLALVFGLFVNEGKFESVDEVKYVVFANCILGALLIWLTTKDNWIATLFFWLGIMAAYINMIIRK